MKRFSIILIALLMSAALVVPAWGQRTAKSHQQCSTKSVKHHVKHHHKAGRHKQKVLMQFKILKMAYNKSIDDARQMFLDYLGSDLPGGTTDVDAIRQAYEQQIAELKETNASQEQQIAGLNATISSQTQQLGEADTTIASLQQQLTDQAATHQQEMDNLNAEKDQQCSIQTETAYNDGMTAGMETCTIITPAGDPQLAGSISTGTHYPYALDVDGSGNTYIVDNNYRSVVGFDSSGSQIATWTSDTLALPVDLAIDSQGNIFILDQGAANPLQKYTPAGQPMAFSADTSGIIFPQGLFIDSQDNVYVTDMGGSSGGRILKFDATGALVATLGEVSGAELFGDMYTDIAVDEANQIIYIVTQMNHMVAKFGMDGTYLGAWQGDLRNPNSIAVGPQGQVYVADTYNSQVDQYDTDGNLTYTIEAAELYRPSRIVVDGTGKLFIAVESYQSIQVYQ